MWDQEINRRVFLELAPLAAVALAACESAPSAPTDAGRDAPQDAPMRAGLPTLGGAPDTHEGRTVAAFVDTVVPGRHRDPTGAPGGIDVGVPGQFFDPALPAAPLVGLLVILIDGVARRVGRHSFEYLDVAARESALEEALRTIEALEFAVQLVRLAFFSTPEAGEHLGYPGPNAGYWDDPEFSFGRPMAREITPDGNYR